MGAFHCLFEMGLESSFWFYSYPPSEGRAVSHVLKSPRTLPPFSEGRFLSGKDYGRLSGFRAQIQPRLDMPCPGFQQFSFTVTRSVNVIGSQIGERGLFWAIPFRRRLPHLCGA